MKCLICRNGGTKAGMATVTLERNGATVVFKEVPADICENCGEEYVSEAITARLLTQAEDAIRNGVEVDVRHYRAA